MSDGVLRALLEADDLTLVVVVASDVSREARAMHHLRPTSAALLAQGLAAGAALAALQKGEGRLNLQLECDGPLGGLLVDASATGALRGYVKNPNLDLEGQPGAFQWRPALGNQGFLSVLSSLDRGEFYRSSVELTAFELSLDLNHYFQASNQVPTRLALAAHPRGAERLGAVLAALVQTLPGGDPGRLDAFGASLPGQLGALAAQDRDWTPEALAAALVPGQELRGAATVPLSWTCACSKQRVLDMLAALPADELRQMLHEQRGAKVSCHFCGRVHQADGADLQALLDRPRA